MIKSLAGDGLLLFERGSHWRAHMRSHAPTISNALVMEIYKAKYEQQQQWTNV